MLCSFAFQVEAEGAQAGLLSSGCKYALRVGFNCLNSVIASDILSSLHALPLKRAGFPLGLRIICQALLSALGM